MRHRGDLRRRDVDTVVFERQGVLLGRQPEIGARLGQDVRPHPGIIVRQLGFQLRVRIVPARELVLLEQDGDPVDVIRVAAECGLNFALGGKDDSRFGDLRQLALLQQLGERLMAGFGTRIFAQPHECRRPPVRRHLIVEQTAQSPENDLAGVEEGHLVLQVEVLLAKLQVERLEENVEIFLDVLVLLRGLSGLELRQYGLEFPPLGELIGEGRIGDAGVEFGHAFLRAFFRRVF